MAVIGRATRTATSDPGWGGFRTAMCWLFAGIGIIYGLVLIALADGWLNDIVKGIVYVIGSPLLAPPGLRWLRARWSVARSVWAPIAYAWALGILSLAISLPFVPSQARQQQLEAAAISDARSLLAHGKPADARMALRKFAGRSRVDPPLALLLGKIDRAEKVPAKATVPTALAGTPASTVIQPTAPTLEPNRPSNRSTVEAQAYLTTIQALQNRMNDPTSLLVIGNKVVTEVDGRGKPVLRSYVKYRGSNALGGTVTEAAVLTLSPDGQIVLRFEDATAAL